MVKIKIGEKQKLVQVEVVRRRGREEVEKIFLHLLYLSGKYWNGSWTVVVVA